MLFYKHLFSFWKQYMLLFLFSYHRLFIIFSLSLSLSLFLFLSLLVSSFRPYRSQKRKEGIIFIAVVFSLSFFPSRKYFLLLYIHIYQSEEVRAFARRFYFLLVLAKFGPYIITTILILLFAFAYIYVQE
jgi:hypothetical protein